LTPRATGADRASGLDPVRVESTRPLASRMVTVSWGAAKIKNPPDHVVLHESVPVPVAST
jgi:hypothetical protein